MERKQILAEYTLVGTISAAIVIATLNWLTTTLSISPVTGLPALFVSLLASAGTYLFVFKSLIWLYYNTVWHIFHAQRYIGGQWKYSYNYSYDPKENQWKSEKDRCGIARIEHTAEGITLHGESSVVVGSEGRTSLVATWRSTASSISGERIHLALTIHTGRGVSDGFAIFQIVSRRKKYGIWPVKPKRMVGYYYLVEGLDNAKRYGRIEFERIIYGT